MCGCCQYENKSVVLIQSQWEARKYKTFLQISYYDMMPPYFLIPAPNRKITQISSALLVFSHITNHAA
jgi:hypothetical protein